MKLSWRGVNLLFLGCSAIQSAAEGHLTAFAPLLLRELGLSESEVAIWSGLLFAVTTASALPLGPFWGVLAERFSRRQVILRSYAFTALALLVAAWAPDVGWLIICRVLVGLSFGVGGVIMATQTMLTPRPRLGRAIATVQAAMPIAASLGPPLGALAIPAIGLRGLFLVDAVANLLAALALALLLPEPSGGHKPGSVLGRAGEVLLLVWRLRPVRWNFLSGLLTRGATSVIDSYLPVRIAQIAPDPAAAIGWILGLYGALTTAAIWVVGRIVDRVDETKLYWRAMLLAAILAVGLALAPWLPLVALLAALRSIPVALSNTLLFAHLARVVPREHQTGVFGLSPTARNVGSLLATLLAAAVAGLGTAAALGLSALGYGGAFLTALQLGRVSRRGP